MNARHVRSLPVLALVLSFSGCWMKRPVAPPPLPPPPPVEQPVPPSLRSHLEGTWEFLGRKSGPPRQLTFSSDGTLSFHGGFEFYNPGRWELDEAQKELRLLLPNADYDKLQIFQMTVGDGVKAFDPHRKQVTYHFDAQTWTLNIAGWPYSKEDKIQIKEEAEPVLR